MWCKAVIFFAAVSSAIIAAEAKDDLSTIVQKKLDDYKGLYPGTAEEVYKVLKGDLQQRKELVAELINGIDSRFSYDDTAKVVSDLEAKAKKAGKDISVCLSLNDLASLQTQQINEAIEAINQTYSKSADTLQVYVDDSLRSLELEQKQKLSKFGSDMKQCSSIEKESDQKVCLWKLLSAIATEEIQFNSDAAPLGTTLVFRLFEMQDNINQAASGHLENWQGILKVVVEVLNLCANDVLNN